MLRQKMTVACPHCTSQPREAALQLVAATTRLGFTNCTSFVRVMFKHSTLSPSGMNDVLVDTAQCLGRAERSFCATLRIHGSTLATHFVPMATVIKTRRFLRNPLLQRRQMVRPQIRPTDACFRRGVVPRQRSAPMAACRRAHGVSCPMALQALPCLLCVTDVSRARVRAASGGGPPRPCRREEGGHPG